MSLRIRKEMEEMPLSTNSLKVPRAQALFAMRNFQVLDRVSFHYHGEQKIGTVIRLNQKTISVKLDTGEQWNISPQMLYKVDEENPISEMLLQLNKRNKK
jgi:hypothetical protein